MNHKGKRFLLDVQTDMCTITNRIEHKMEKQAPDRTVRACFYHKIIWDRGR